MKLLLIVLSTTCCAGCATHEVQQNIQSKIPPGTEKLLENAYQLIEAYENNDSKKWSELRCMASTNEKVFGLSATKFLGKFSSPRLVSISSTTDAGNSMGRFKSSQVAIEVKAAGYPVGKLLLKFIEDKEGKCIGLIF
jgi:hypothetical protein